VDAEFIRDLFAPFGPVTVRRMFSGAGLFRDGLMFGLLVRDVIYLKADDGNAADFEREGCTPFTYTRGKPSDRPSQHALPYWRLPERLYDDPDELAAWARRSFEAAERRKFKSRRPPDKNSATKKPQPMKTMSFGTAKEFRIWLSKNHSRSEGILLRIYKKGAEVSSATYAEALDQALCFGWIDGQKQPYDDDSWIQKFTPRRPKSAWSRNNTKHAERLIASGDMTAAGLKEVKAARDDGRWKTAYESFSKATIPDDFLKQLLRNKKAGAFFATLNKTNLYSIAYRLQTAKKPETRQKRMRAIIEMLARGEKFH
jgi:uncharacterized protein YdeI (YjbR/CyaY-like superfamily)/TfoX/Sxy family transcriptional regulator of competence genes